MQKKYHSESRIETTIKKLDYFFEKNDLVGAGIYLREELVQSRINNNWEMEMSLLNELIGFYRKTDEKEKAFQAIHESFQLIEEKKMEESVTAGTIWLNGATTMKAFGKAKDALVWFERAKKIFQKLLNPNDYKAAGLYNNMALSYMDLKEYERALFLFEKAKKVVLYNEKYIELAVTHTNIAQLYEEWSQDEDEIYKNMMKAYEYLNKSENRRDGYYAFNCKKCAGSFDYYGFFRIAKELNERADEIYERT